MQTTAIDNGFLLISSADAKKLAVKLPKHGREKLVVHNGGNYWLSRTMHQGEQRWSMRPTKWRLVNGYAVLG